MKKACLLMLCLSGIFLWSACGSKPEPEAPVSVVQEEAQEEIGVVFAHDAKGDFYYNIAGNNTEVLYKTGEQIEKLNELEGAWRFSVVETKEDYPYMLFNGYLEAESGYIGSLFGYGKETGVFFRFFEEMTSNAVVLPTTDENYADLAWTLVQFSDGACLCPINMRDGSVEMGQIVNISERGYLALTGFAVLKADVKQPLLVTIEHRSYVGDSSVTEGEFTYNFETNIFEGDELVDPIEEESEQNN